MSEWFDWAKTPSALKRELWWLALGFLAACVIGLITRLPLALPIAYLGGYAIWQLNRMTAIVDWLQKGASPRKAPPTVGLMNQVIELVHREKKYSRKQKNRYRSTLAQFNSLAAELPDATVVLDELRQIRWSNNAARTLLNVYPERDRGQRIDNLLRDPEFHDFLREADPSVELELPAPANSELTLAIRFVTSGKKMNILIARDVTQRVKIREMRKAFVGDVSHELRTPLTVIQGYLEMLLEDPTLSDSARDGLQNVATQSNRMSHIVEHLLELSKLEGNPLAEDEGEPIAVSSLVQSLVSAIQQSTDTDHQFELQLDQNLSLLGSEGEIYSACHNLITNAVKYTREGTRVSVDWHVNADGQPVLAVSDNGQGIEARHLPRLSERFYRVDKGRSRSSGGTGLGLAIVKHAVQRHGGELVIDSTPGVGSIFRVEFPASRAVESRAAVNL